MPTVFWRRCAALVLLLTTTLLTATGCDRRAGDPALPSTTNPGTMPGSSASAASR